MGQLTIENSAFVDEICTGKRAKPGLMLLLSTGGWQKTIDGTYGGMPA
jgi:hypothetical protein